MFSFKYYDDYQAIKAAQRQTTGALTFDLDQLGADSWLQRLKLGVRDWLFRAAFAVFRAVWPVPRFGRFVIISRDADVRHVLRRPLEFNVPYGPEMRELAGGENFVLGLEDVEHGIQNTIIRQVIHEGDGAHEGCPAHKGDPAKIAASSRRFARALIASSGGRIDVMKDLVTRVATETCGEYFGIRVDDPDEFAEWTMSISALLFADPFGDPATRQLALSGAARVRALIDRSIRDDRFHVPDSLLVRLLKAKGSNPALTDEKIRAILVGLAAGFIPTNTLAAGRILQELLRRRQTLDAAIAAACAAEGFERAGTPGTNRHKEELKAILFEAARLNPALTPGQWRYAPNATSIITSKGRTVHIAQGSVLMVSTMSALRDSAAVKRPNSFDPKRKPSSIDLMFGNGAHECLGKNLAIEQITEIFQVLLSQEGLHFTGKLRWTGPFPRRLEVEFDSARPAAVQEMLTICAPLKPGSTKAHLEQLIAGLDKTGINGALKQTEIVHFASLSVIEAGKAAEPSPFLILELNVDGTKERAIHTVAKAVQRHLEPIFAHTPAGGSNLARTFASYAIDLKSRPWGATGLNYKGTGEFSVADIEMQQRLAAFARKVFAHFIMPRAGFGSQAMDAVRFMRDVIRQHPRYVEAAKSDAALAALLQAGSAFKDHLVLPSSRRLLISDWKDRAPREAVVDFLTSRDVLVIAVPFAAVMSAVAIGIYSMTGSNVWLGILLSFAGGLFSTIVLAGVVAGLFVWRLRQLERSDQPDDQDPPIEAVRAAAARENLPGYAQNHFMAVTLLKPGWFRKLTLALSLWGIRQLVTHAYRPGFVLDMGTIHYAKWFRLPKTDKLIFLSNFDGSWESYLEDFIMKAHPGQTAAWSNGVGFPKTRFLVYDGASDGDRFKRWVRRQQVPTQFWYSHFPDLTTDQIRNNAVIHQGLARANTDSAARSLLDCFGSMQQPDHSMETEEIQSLVFAGFKQLHYASYALVDLPDDRAARAAWLDALVPYQSVLDDRRSTTPEDCEVTFGDRPFNPNLRLQDQATFVAFSASGLQKLGLPADATDDGLSTFPSAFNLGMHNRERILGDRHDEFPWRWSDARRKGEKTGRVPTADAIVVVYAATATQCKAALASHDHLLGGRSFIDVIHCEPIDKHLPPDQRVFREHFGFRDGLSQPVIRGTQRSVEGVHDRDVVEPGEFVLGYRDNQGYVLPALRVSSATDIGDRLPNVFAARSSPFPSFDATHGEARDFGRNGSFLAVRQIEQHVETFDNFTNSAATHLRTRFTGANKAVGANITADWVAAKMMGRWKDGAPLVLRPGADRHPVAAENDFTFAHDDPQGLRCPFGAHIRRSNPRDGLRPNDPMQQAITNRHRLLRRGRPYEISEEDAKRGGAKGEKGLVFTCLCSDLERQFEFVQQTWIGSSSFHGLTDEVDPIISWPSQASVFTIPTLSGPITLDGLQRFVTVRAGDTSSFPADRRSSISRTEIKSTAHRRTRRPDRPPFLPCPFGPA